MVDGGSSSRKYLNKHSIASHLIKQSGFGLLDVFNKMALYF